MVSPLMVGQFQHSLNRYLAAQVCLAQRIK